MWYKVSSIMTFQTTPAAAFKILRATHLGMCFGVRDAIDLALNQTKPITILGDLVHNETVLHQLRAQGVKMQDQVADITTQAVMITAHGASQRRLDLVRRRGLKVLEATCPLVHHAHRAVAQMVAKGCHPVIIGRRDHVEVRGLTEDLEDYDIILTEGDVEQLRERPRFGIAAQTTQPIDRVRHLVGLIRNRFPGSEVHFHDTVCQPTKQRQTAAIELAAQCDVVVVIGGSHSNNTLELVATCRQQCRAVHHVQSAAEVCPEWFSEAAVVGITAGTSTPDTVIEEVEQCLQALANRSKNLREKDALLTV